MNQSSHGLWGWLKSFAFYILAVLSPDWGKRILLLTSLHAQLVQAGVLQAETVDKLNESLHLADRDTALNFGAFASASIWDSERLSTSVKSMLGNAEPLVCITPDQAARVSRQILELAPPVLKYGSDYDMLRDFTQLFCCNPSGPAHA